MWHRTTPGDGLRKRSQAPTDSLVFGSATIAMVFKTVVFLPWLPLKKPISFAQYSLAPTGIAVTHLDPDDACSVSAIASTFIEASEEPAQSAVIWKTHDSTCVTEQEIDLDEFIGATRLLGLAALIRADYFSILTPPTALNFDVVAQRFTPGSKYFAIRTRRRDGNTSSGGHLYEKTRFTRPVAAPSDPHIELDPALLGALDKCLTEPDQCCDRIVQAAEPFLLANRMDGSSTLQSDVFWTATAIEQLLDGAYKRKVGITNAFSCKIENELAKNRTHCTQLLVRTWARELYGHRSNVHGETHRSNKWDLYWHAFLATNAFVLLVIQLLAECGHYKLCKRDEIALEAFPQRVARMHQRRLECAEDIWRETAKKSSWALASRTALAELRGSGGATDQATK